MYSIKHRPQIDTQKVIEHYSKKDGVPISYVCTTELKPGSYVYDVFYRDTPHPTFGNRYFGLTIIGGQVYIGDADKVEELDFCMMEVNGEYHYSQCTHDFYCVDGFCIDGGRSYGRFLGDPLPKTVYLKVKDGGFIYADH